MNFISSIDNSSAVNDFVAPPEGFIVDKSTLGEEIFGAKLGILHLLCQSGLLAFQHVVQKVVKLQSIRQWQITSKEQSHQGIAEGNLILGPSTCSGNIWIVTL
jgi:hypothetical protein